MTWSMLYLTQPTSVYTSQALLISRPVGQIVGVLTALLLGSLVAKLIKRKFTSRNSSPSKPNVKPEGTAMTEPSHTTSRNAAWLERKVEMQRREIERCHEVMAAARDRQLAEKYVTERGNFDYLKSILDARESAYVKGYSTGWSAALTAIRHPLLGVCDAEGVNKILDQYTP